MGQDKFMMMTQNDTVSLNLSIFVLWLGMGRDLGTMSKVIFQRWDLVSPCVWVNPSSILVLLFLVMKLYALIYRCFQVSRI